MAECGVCGGLGRVAAGGMTGQFARTFGGAGVHECGRCRGTGRGDATEDMPLPHPRNSPRSTALSVTLPGDWLVEIHGSGRILAVMRFLLTRDGTARRFEARCDYGGILGWSARGDWAIRSGDVIWFTGTQSSPYLLTTRYGWGAVLDRVDHDVLHGESIAREWTRWSRRAAVPMESGVPEIIPVAFPVRR